MARTRPMADLLLAAFCCLAAALPHQSAGAKPAPSAPLSAAADGVAARAEPQRAPERPAPARLTIDLETGRILEAADIDSPRPPASLAKLMTAYVAFEALAAGEVSREDEVEISFHAASRPPVGVGLRPGQKIPFGELLDAALVASANDAAAAVGETLAGSEDAFAARMNQTATRLGLADTVFRNASGLPADGQRITARDAAVLAGALLRDHPSEAAVFAERQVAIAGRALFSTNTLLGRVRGVVGMKTGFTCAAGYSLVSLAEDGSRRILAVGLSFPSRPDRDAALRAQIERGFAATPGVGPRLRPADPDPRRPRRRELRRFPGCAPGGVGAGRPVGYAAFLGAYARRGAADQALRVARQASQGRGASFVRRRGRDRRWAALLHGLRPKDATRVCLAARRSGRYCVRLSPTALRAPKAVWR